jgi:hypothetical protein
MPARRRREVRKIGLQDKLLIINMKNTSAFAGVKSIDLVLLHLAELKMDSTRGVMEFMSQ